MRIVERLQAFKEKLPLDPTWFVRGKQQRAISDLAAALNHLAESGKVRLEDVALRPLAQTSRI